MRTLNSKKQDNGRMIAERFFCPEKNCIISTSYKVMFSTLSAQKYFVPNSHPVWIYIRYRLLMRKFLLTRTKHIVLVRNPYDRLVSFYFDKFRTHPLRFQDKGFNWKDDQKRMWPTFGISPAMDDKTISEKMTHVSFAQFINELPRLQSTIRHLHFQINTLYEIHLGVLVRLRIDKLIRMEKLDELREWGVDTSIVRNKTERQQYMHYYNKALYRIVNTVYKEDFEQFGYKMQEDKKSLGRRKISNK